MTTVYRNCRTLAAGTLLLFLQGAAWAETKVQGTAEALRIETSDSPIQEVLASLRDAFQLEYRTSVQLEQSITGTYQGSLQRVLTRVLDGYDFILKNSSEKTELVVLGRKGSGGPSQPLGDPVVNTDQLATANPVNNQNPINGKAIAAKAATPQKAQQQTVPAMLTILAQQQIPGSGGSAATSTPAASASSSGSSNSGNSGNSGSTATVPTQAEIAALTQQAAGKLEALRSSLQRVGR
jgi:hypothetical protein